MSKKQQVLSAISSAVYGEEVRGAIHDGIEECYDNVENKIVSSNTAPTSSNTQIWIDTSQTSTDFMPQVDDAHVSSTDTWSSQKITDEIGQLSEEIDDLKKDIIKVNLLDFPYQKGVLNSIVANQETNTIAEIASSNTRAVVGPVKFRKSVILKNDESIYYKLYKRYSNSTASVFRDMYSSWRTTSAIEGVNPITAQTCNYYIQLSYTNNRTITDLKDLLSKLEIVETDENPLGLVEGVTFETTTAKPETMGTTDALRMISYKIAPNAYKKIVTLNPNFQMVLSQGTDIYTSASNGQFNVGARILSNEYQYALMIRKMSGSSPVTLMFKDYGSFADLYADIGLSVSDMIPDNDMITGNQLTDPARIVDADTYGKQIKTNIFTNGKMLDDDGAIVYAHVPSVEIYNGFAYVTFMANRTNGTEFSEYSEIDLAIVNLEDLSTEYIVIAKSGSYGGMTFNGRCSYPALARKDNKLYIYFSGTVSGDQTLCCSVYDIDNGTFATQACKITYGGTEYTFNNSNFTINIGGPEGMISLGYEIGICNPTTDGTNWYAAVASGSAGQMKVPLIKSTDMLNWTIYDIFPFEYGADCECVVHYKSNKLYCASRHPYKACTTRLFIYDIANKRITEDMQIASCASRPTFFDNGSSVAVSIPQTGRRTMTLMQLSLEHLRDSRLGASFSTRNSLAYNAIKNASGNTYMAIQTRQIDASSTNVKTYPAIFFGYCSQLSL